MRFLCLKGTARVDQRTKHLVQRLKPNEIAVIDHQDLDVVAAESLIRCRPRAVVNAAASLTCSYPNSGPLMLVRAGIPLIDSAGPEIMSIIHEGDELSIDGDVLFCRGLRVGCGRRLTEKTVAAALDSAHLNFPHEVQNFIQNTLSYAIAEVEDVLNGLDLPPSTIALKGRQVLVVVRGERYREDLQAIRTYIKENRPVCIGVDGGADALLEYGYRPDLIVGDMDSVSDHALRCGASLVVHAYPDGRAPGMERLRRLGLAADTIRAAGTSEDLALLLAHQQGAALIVIVGSHASVLDFLGKGRRGMASTLLTRMKVGSILVDAKGVSLLYRERFRLTVMLQLVGAAFLTAILVLSAAPATQQLLRLVALRLRLAIGI